jgi:DNA phosphorothioation-associated DGQHR protein 1
MSSHLIECIKIQQPIGEFYIASLPSSLLKKVTFSRSAGFNEDNIEGNQRNIDNTRVKEIGHFIDGRNATIPNSIILTANYYESDELEVDGGKRWEVIEDKGRLYIEIPDDSLKLCSIVDGQHRINGFNWAETEMYLPCSVFIDLPPSLQALIFSTVNFNQQKVDKSLAYQLFGYQLNDEDKKSWSPDILAVQLSRAFNSLGPFKNKIELIKGSKTEIKPLEGEDNVNWSISSAAFIAGVCSLISGNLKKDKYVINKKNMTGYGTRKDLKAEKDYPRKLKNYPLRGYFVEGNDVAIKMVLERYFEEISKTLWLNKEEDSIVFRTVGISAQFTFLKELITNQKVELNSSLSFEKVLDRFNEIEFNNEYFSPRTATKSRLLNVFKLKSKMITVDGLDPEIIKSANISD